MIQAIKTSKYTLYSSFRAFFLGMTFSCKSKDGNYDGNISWTNAGCTAQQQRHAYCIHVLLAAVQKPDSADNLPAMSVPQHPQPQMDRGSKGFNSKSLEKPKLFHVTCQVCLSEAKALRVCRATGRLQWLHLQQSFHYRNEAPGSLTNKLGKCLALPPAWEAYQGVITVPPLSIVKLSQTTWWGGKKDDAIHKCSRGLCDTKWLPRKRQNKQKMIPSHTLLKHYPCSENSISQETRYKNSNRDGLKGGGAGWHTSCVSIPAL